jgi:hypothetical protein
MDGGTAKKGGDWPCEVLLNAACMHRLADTNEGHAERMSLHLDGMIELFLETESYLLEVGYYGATVGTLDG